MPRPGWTLRQTHTGAKMWRAGDAVADIAKAIGKEPQAIYGYARDNRELFPKRTRGARKKRTNEYPIPPFDPIPPEEMDIKSSRTMRSLKQSIMVNERKARAADKRGQPKAAENYRHAAALNKRELQILEERENG